jgi:hypothetical protein
VRARAVGFDLRTPGEVNDVNVLIWIAFAVVVVAVLLIGGRAERFNLSRLTRPWQPKYRRDDDDELPG